MLNRTRKKIIISLAIFLAGLALLFWLTAPQLLEPEIERRIESYGFENVDIAGIRLYPNGANIKTIAFKYNGRTAVATGIQIRWEEYDPNRIVAVDIDKGEVSVDFNDLANPLGLQLEFPEKVENARPLPDVSFKRLDIILQYKDDKALLTGQDIVFKRQANSDIYDFVGGFTGKDALLNGAINIEGTYKQNGVTDIKGQLIGANLNIPDETPDDTVGNIIENLNATATLLLNGTRLQNIAMDYTASRLSVKGVHLERISGQINDGEKDALQIQSSAFGIDDSLRMTLDAALDMKNRHVKGMANLMADDAAKIPAAITFVQVSGLTGAVGLDIRYSLTMTDIKNASLPANWRGALQVDIKAEGIEYRNIKDLNADIKLEYDLDEQVLTSDISFYMGQPAYKGRLALRLKDDQAAGMIVIQGNIDQISSPDFKIITPDLDAIYHKADQKTDFTLHDLSFTPLGTFKNIPALTGSLSGQYVRTGIDFNFKGQDKSSAFAIDLKGDFSPATGIIKADYSLTPQRALKTSDIAKIVPETLDLEGFSGRITVDGAGEYNDKGFVSSQNVKLADIKATMNGLRFLGVNGIVTVKTSPDIVISSPDLFIGGFDVGGLPLKNGTMAFTYSAQDNRLDVEKMNWALAGGTVLAPPFSLNTRTMDTSLTLQAQNLNLTELMAITPLEGLTATGKVSGHIPVILKDDKIRIDQGHLKAVDEGRIRYNPEKTPAFLQTENEYMGMVREALKDYHYDILSLTVNGETGENQSVRIEATGSNPSFFDGRPVNLNLNVEGDLEDILRFNLGTYALPERIKKQMEQFQE